MKVVVAVISLMAAPAIAEESPSLLDLYAASSLMGMHSHPIGFEGRKLGLAERVHNLRRRGAALQLAKRFGTEAVEKIDADLLDQQHDIYYTRGPTVEEEWRTIYRARNSLFRLEKRMKQSGMGQ